jgi:hypothetical protein
MRYVCLTGLLFLASHAWSQEEPLVVRLGIDATAARPQQAAGGGGDQTTEAKKVPNPFAQPPRRGAAMGLGGGMEGMGTGGMEEMMADMEMDTGMDMEMDTGMGMGMEYTEILPDELFRRGLQRAIHSLKNAKSDEEGDALRGYVRAAFSERYDKMIVDRKRDVAKLKNSIAKLEQDLKRREFAKERVVQLQLQSVQLAAEGLLDLGDLQGVSGRSPGGQGPGYGGGGGAFDKMEDDYGAGR